MQMNLKLLADNNRLTTQLTKYVEANNADKARSFLCRYFPSSMLVVIHDRLILDMSELIVGIIEDKAISDNELRELKANLNHLLSHYRKKKKESERKMFSVVHQSPINYLNQVPSSWQFKSTDLAQVQALLYQFDIREQVNSYSEGYEYEKFRALSWMVYQIDESISGKTHDTKVTIKDPLDI